MTRVPKIARGKISLVCSIQCCPNFLHFFRPTSLSNCEEHVYMPTRLTAYRRSMNYRCYQITLQWNIFTQIGAVRSADWVGYLSMGRRAGGDRANTWHWAERFTVCFLYSKWQQHSYWHILLLIAFLEGTFIINMCLYRVLIIVIIIVQ